MLTWDCCRTCLSTQNLNPIFSSCGQNEKYMYAILTAFGIKIEPNDNLPQKMCTDCIEYVNTSKKFRKKAEESLKELLRRLRSIEIDDSKLSGDAEKQKSITSATVDLYDDGLGFGGYDDEDDVTLDNFKQKCKVKEECSKNQEEYECNEQVTIAKPNIIFDENQTKPNDILFNDKKNNTTAKPAKRKPRKKSDNVIKEENKSKRKGEKRERVREEVECEYCHKRLTSKLSLRNHYKIHTGFDVVCEHCGKKFITRRLLLMHCRAKHGYEKTDKCSYCDYRASNAEQVKIHERLHTGEKPYVCAECGAGFHRKSSYLQHVAIHLPEKTVQCDQCPARFKSVTLMRIHSYRHRPTSHTYRCGECGAVFTRRRAAAAHATRTHRLPPAAAVQRVMA